MERITTAGDAAQVSADQEFVYTRTFDAPRDLVWRALTEPGHLVHWWGPRGFTVRVAEVDLRRGGIFRYILRSPDGWEMGGRWVFQEIAAPERLVTLTSFTDVEGNPARHSMNPVWPLEMHTVTSLTEAGGKTTLTIRVTPHNASDEERQAFFSELDGMGEGFAGTLDKLDGYLSTIQ